MSLSDQYRPPGRSNRSGRAHNDNDVFEGLPVKQWGQSITHVSLAPPKSEEAVAKDEVWGEPPMPRDYQLLQPWTQQLLRLARSGKVGTKRKADPDSMDDEKGEEEGGEEAKASLEDRGFVAKKWRLVPEAALEPEHKHFEFLAKRRKGLPSLYGPEPANGAAVAMRKTKVQKAGPDGEVAIYEVLVPEGQTVEGEVAETTELADIKPVLAAPGTVIEGVGIANDEGVVVAEHLKPAVAPRRNRPPPKKKGGPGRGKKRVTFTNPDGSTYTTIVPNATKIVPQPGQTVTHVAKGEEARADVTAEQAAASAATRTEGEGEGSEEEGEEGDDDDEREEGELSEDDAPTAGVTPVPGEKSAAGSEAPAPVKTETETETEDVSMEDAPALPAAVETLAPPTEEEEKGRDASSSPELPLAKTSHSRTGSLNALPAVQLEAAPEESIEQPATVQEDTQKPEIEEDDDEEFEPAPAVEEKEDLLDSLEKTLENKTTEEAA